jgi:hypothetical protein
MGSVFPLRVSPMKAFQFIHVVANLVSVVADRPLHDVDPDANILAYFDEGAEVSDQVLAARECAQEILFEAGFPVEV